jgi:type II secretory pathway pseudopilin PulG
MNRKGQILLIMVMLLATLMTIALSVSFKSTTDAQTTKLEEESQKALTAAESAIEVALKENGNVTIGRGSLSTITGFEGSATIQSSTDKTFTTPIIKKDESYTFYLGNYNISTKTITPATDPNDLTLCFETGSTKPAIEITLVKTGNVKKYVIDPSSRISNSSTGSSCTPDPTNYSYSTKVLASDIGADGQFLVVRVFYGPTKLFFSRNTNLPIQGRTISSEVTSSTSTGVSKKIALFQSYPQIPGEFFATSF